MSTRLDGLISSARELDGAWDGERSGRVRVGALRRREVRACRDRTLRRALMVAGGVGLLVLGLLRAASSAPAASPVANSPKAEAVAFRALGDAGDVAD